MLHSVNSRHDGETCRVHDVEGATAVYGHQGLFAAGLASSWSLTENLPAMDHSTYGCYDPPSTPAAFLSPPSLPPPGIYRATTAAVGELQRYCPPPSHVDVDTTPPYFVGDRRIPPDVLDRATSGFYAGMYRDTPLSVTGGGGDLCSPSDDRDCSVRAVLLTGDALRRTAATLTPPPSMFAWHGGQTSFSSAADHDPVRRLQSYYNNIAVDIPSCRSPVGADPAVDIHDGGQQSLTAAASMVRPLPRETRRRAAERVGATTLVRRPRTNFTAEQLCRLRQFFADCPYIDVHQRAKIAASLGLTETQVKVWFQNQRSKMKRLQRTGDDLTPQHSADSCMFSHQQQLQPGVSMATVVKETRSDVGKENDASFAEHLNRLTSTDKIHTVSWRPK